MNTSANIKTTFERIVQAMTRQPEIAKGKIFTKAIYKEGLVCDIACGPWKFSADMSKKAGGTETAPSPGQYMSAALGSCQLITTALWAARFDVPIEKLEITVEVDKDSRGLYGVSDNPSRWKAIKYRVDITSTAPEAAVQKALDAAHVHSPMRDNLEYPFHIGYEYVIKAPVVTNRS